MWHTLWERKGVYSVWVAKLEGKRQRGRPRRSWERLDWMCLTQDIHMCGGWALVNLVMNLWVPDGPGKLSRYSESLRAGRFGDSIPVWARFSVPVQTVPGAHPASYTMGTGSFPGVKRPGRGVDHPPSSSAEVKERVGLYLYSSSGPSLLVEGWT